MLLCTAIACERLPAPNHGRIVSEDDISQFRSNVTLVCDRGYQLTGSVTRTCLSNGTWDGSPAVCQSTSFHSCTAELVARSVKVVI